MRSPVQACVECLCCQHVQSSCPALRARPPSLHALAPVPRHPSFPPSFPAQQEFCELWAEYDDGTSLIDPKDLEQILMRMRPPMGLGPKANGTDVVRFVFALDIPLVDGKVGGWAGGRVGCGAGYWLAG